jgi:hypothetical protein
LEDPDPIGIPYSAGNSTETYQQDESIFAFGEEANADHV